MRIAGVGVVGLLALVVGSCAVGAPLGFSSGDNWAFPLVAPLEDGEYLVPVKINGKGPYLFMIDSDATVSSVDAAIVSEHELYTVRAQEQLDERDKMVPTALAEVPKMQIGDQLTVSSMKVHVHQVGTYQSGGRIVRGILGRDVIADSLVFAADRDTGMAYVATQGKYAAPAGAAQIKYRTQLTEAGRKRLLLTTATINDSHKATMHVDLGGRFSQLWQNKMESLKLPKLGVRARTVDELATVREVTFAAMTASVRANDVEVNGVLMLPYEDRRVREIDADGSLGMNFFAPYNIVANWHKKTLWLTARTADPGAGAKARIQRWGKAFDGCANLGCATITMQSNAPPPAPAPGAIAPDPVPDAPTPDADPAAPEAEQPEAGAPAPPAPPQRIMAPPRYTLVVAREAGAPNAAYDLLVEAVDASGQPLGLPSLLVTLPAGRAEVIAADFDPNYRQAATFRVLDASPFPRECDKATGQCVFILPPKR
ncbi:MAG TPA: aspartyl protease family protein [Kofleriaceae bacterium]|nr:aspartyl protease family protein [Kofleriaceae bacterium]